jgi:hypothetical protein
MQFLGGQKRPLGRLRAKIAVELLMPRHAIRTSGMRSKADLRQLSWARRLWEAMAFGWRGMRSRCAASLSFVSSQTCKPTSNFPALH